jgi:hypothetical protein
MKNYIIKILEEIEDIKSFSIDIQTDSANFSFKYNTNTDSKFIFPKLNHLQSPKKNDFKMLAKKDTKTWASPALELFKKCAKQDCWRIKDNTFNKCINMCSDYVQYNPKKIEYYFPRVNVYKELVEIIVNTNHEQKQITKNTLELMLQKMVVDRFAAQQHYIIDIRDSIVLNKKIPSTDSLVSIDSDMSTNSIDSIDYNSFRKVSNISLKKNQ